MNLDGSFILTSCENPCQCSNLNGITNESRSDRHPIKEHKADIDEGIKPTISSKFKETEGDHSILLSPENLLMNDSLATDNTGHYNSIHAISSEDDRCEEPRWTLPNHDGKPYTENNKGIGNEKAFLALPVETVTAKQCEPELSSFQTDTSIGFPRKGELKTENALLSSNKAIGARNNENKLAIISDNVASNHYKPLPIIFEAPKVEVEAISKDGNCLEVSGLRFKTNILSVPYAQKIPKTLTPTQHFGKVAIEKSKNTSFGTEITTAGDLTIIQHVDLSKGLSPNPELTITDSSESSGWCQKLRYLWATLFLGVVITAAVTGALIVFLNDIQQAQDDGGNADGGDDVPANYTMKLVTRRQWSQHPNAKIDNLRHTPVSYVVVCHSASNFCNSPSTCTNMIRGIESWGMNTGFSSIAYNFLIGGDGFIYEGRGWTKQGAFSRPINCKSIGVAFVGNFDHDTLLPSMVEAYNILVEEGVRRGALTKDYKMVGAYQVKNNASPGLNIRSVIKDWPHWGPLTSNDTLCTK